MPHHSDHTVRRHPLATRILYRSPALAAAALVALAAPAAAFAHGDEVPIDQLPGAWRFEVTPIVASLVVLGLFLRAWLKLRGRGRADHASYTHLALFSAGVLVALGALVSPLDAIGEEYLLVAHMAQHQLLLDVSPALAMLGLRGPIGAFLIPAPVLGPLARNRGVRAVFGVVTSWWVALVGFIAAIAAWHIPASYDAALRHQWIHDLEHLSFAVVGALLWLQIVDPARREQLSRKSRAVLVIAVLAAVHLIVHPILLSGGVKYTVYAQQDERLGGISAIADQHWSAVFMTTEEVLVLGAAILVLAWPMLTRLGAGSVEARARELDAQAEGQPD